MSLCDYVCVCVTTVMHLHFCKRHVDKQRTHKQNPMQILLKTQNFKVNTAAARSADGAEAASVASVSFVCLSCQAKRFSSQMTNFHLALTRCRLRVVSLGNFFLHGIITSLASRLQQLSLLLFMCPMLCVCVIYRVSQQTPIISVCKQQFAPQASGEKS